MPSSGQLAAIIGKYKITSLISCVFENFAAGLVPYSFTGNSSLFSIVATPYGSDLGIHCATQNTSPPATAIRSIGPKTGDTYSVKFQCTDLNSDDAAVIYFKTGSTLSCTINPRRESSFDASRRIWLSLDSEVGVTASPGSITVNTWYQCDIAVNPGAGNSTYTITQLPSTVIQTGTFVNSHTSALIDSIEFFIDSSGPTSSTEFGDISVCSLPPATFGTAQFFTPTGTTQGVTALTLSGGNLIGTAPFGWQASRVSSTTNQTTYTVTDKRYFEIVVGTGNFGGGFGFITNAGGSNNVINPFNTGVYCMLAGNVPGSLPSGVIVNGIETNSAAYGISTGGATIGIAINGANGNVFFSINGTWIGTQNPSTDSNPAFTLPNQNFTAFVTAGDTLTNYPSSVTFSAKLGGNLTSFPPVNYKPWNQTN